MPTIKFKTSDRRLSQIKGRVNSTKELIVINENEELKLNNMLKHNTTSAPEVKRRSTIDIVQMVDE